VVEAIDAPLLAAVRERGAQLLAGLASLRGVVEARGRGLLVGAELDTPAQPVVDTALEAGLVCLTSGPGVLRLAPPLVVEGAHIDRALEILTEVLG
jgi:acetylornithine/succinyldiaminopimelate/putrescine aminotransferase